jgi:hypothetical protein
VPAARLTLLACLVAVVAAALALGPAARPADGYSKCRFRGQLQHEISERRHISCGAAKATLRKLRGRRDTIPMICGKPRWIGGWWVENTGRLFSGVVNRYKKGRVSFVYLREQEARRSYCRPPYGSGEAGT